MGDPQPGGPIELGQRERLPDAGVLTAIAPGVEQDHLVAVGPVHADRVLVGAQGGQEVNLGSSGDTDHRTIAPRPAVPVQVAGLDADADHADLAQPADKIGARPGELLFRAGRLLEQERARPVQCPPHKEQVPRQGSFGAVRQDGVGLDQRVALVGDVAKPNTLQPQVRIERAQPVQRGRVGLTFLLANALAERYRWQRVRARPPPAQVQVAGDGRAAGDDPKAAPHAQRTERGGHVHPQMGRPHRRRRDRGRVHRALGRGVVHSRKGTVGDLAAQVPREPVLHVDQRETDQVALVPAIGPRDAAILQGQDPVGQRGAAVLQRSQSLVHAFLPTVAT